MWCASSAWWPTLGAGSVLVSYVNMADAPASFSFFGQETGPTGGVGPYTTFFITSQEASSSPAGHSSTDPPPSIFGDVSFLNGVQLAVNADGTLPVWPLPGVSVPAGQSAVEVPPWSYGFVALSNIAGLLPATGCPVGSN